MVWVRLEWWHERYISPNGQPASFNRERYRNPEVSHIIDLMAKLQVDDKCSVSLLFQGASIDDRLPIHFGLRRPLFRRFWQGPWLLQAGEALQGLRPLLAAADGEVISDPRAGDLTAVFPG